MTVVYFDSPMSDDERRQKLFTGDLFVFSPTPHSLELCAFAREMAEEAFSPHFPPDAQHHMAGKAHVDVLARLKPTFINHPHSKKLGDFLRATDLAHLPSEIIDSYDTVPA